MNRIFFSLSVERTWYQGRYFYIRAGYAVQPQLRVERGRPESTRAPRIFSRGVSPRKHVI